ncbi:hypothetical protein [Clostridium luticellarii]|uniref:Uncharacterized protein n=1 Tax=Clostridium luticellarii TaxID=1691940 RepID=A0A2T0BNU0_9CLOT|nr:hypothetical protein [Clostridium luticellarii]PRR85549.1 hypothetical protein CLLU_14700 [Clostridium luticellarii]
MTYEDVVNKLIRVVVEGIANTTDAETLEKYQRILDFFNQILERGE